MTSRERMIRAIEFTGPDRAPVWHGVLPAAHANLGEALDRLLEQYPADLGPADYEGPSMHSGFYGVGTYTDQYGCVWHNTHEGISGIVKGHPLDDWDKLSSYRLPDFSCGDWSRVSEVVGSHDKYTLGAGGNLFERMQWIRGYENLMSDFATRDRRAWKLRDMLVECYLPHIEQWCKTEVQGISFSDDWGTQNALMVRPDFWHEFFEPAYERMFRPCKEAGKHVHFHTDGWVWDIIGPLRDIGCDGVNVQQSLMGVQRVAEEFGGTICFRTDLDRQVILPFGTPQQVREHTREVLEVLKPFNGGVIAGGEIGADVPLENVQAMLEAFEEFGGY